MIPQENPYTKKPDLLFKVPQLAHEVELEIKRYLADELPDVPIESLDFDNVNQRIMYPEDSGWQRRRDAYDTATLLHLRYKELKALQENQRQLGVNIGFDSAAHAFSPATILALLRQQIANWQYVTEHESSITIYDVRAALQRRFYQAYKGVKRLQGYTDTDIVDLYELNELADQAVLLDKEYDFEPAPWAEVTRFGEFMQSVTER